MRKPTLGSILLAIFVASAIFYWAKSENNSVLYVIAAFGFVAAIIDSIRLYIFVKRSQKDK